VEFLLLDGGHLASWRAAAFGYVFLVRALHFLPRVDLFLKAAQQLLSPTGGLVVISFPLFTLTCPGQTDGVEGQSGELRTSVADPFIPDPNFFHPGSASKNLSI
jgi:hypothetical protein